MSRHHKQLRLDARWLVTGLDTAARIQHHGQRAYLLPVRPGHHRSRFSKGQRLKLKAYVPGPTEANLIVTGVQGLREAFTLGHVDDTTARELGYHDAGDFRLAWVEHNDDEWVQKVGNQALEVIPAYLERFEQRWAHKLAWLIRFQIDHTAEPWLLAARSDELYVTNPAMALAGELPALRPDEWELHVGPKSRYREWDRRRHQKQAREAQTLQQRLEGAKQTARTKGYDIRDETRRLDRLIAQGRTDQARKQIQIIEQRVYPQAA